MLIYINVSLILIVKWLNDGFDEIVTMEETEPRK